MGKMYEALQKAEKERTPELKTEPVKASVDNAVLDDKLVAFFQSSSIVSEQFRKLRTYLFRPSLENKPKTILVTSSFSGDGKSLIAINLAITIAVELHSHAMLVDCDLRNPTLSRWFGMTESKGLSDYLLGYYDLPDLLVKTQIDKLSLLTGGSTQDNPVELIASKRMETLVDELKSRYNDRYIILDSSPVLATTEPSVLDRMVDGIIFVVRAGETPRESVQQAVKMLGKEKIIGVVLNDMNFKSSALHSRYFGTNRYYYDYGYSKEIRPQNFFQKVGSVFKKSERG
ncbi:MAG: CpsD/CapB family tyrosine-protein kinase [Proteobacteria bacterium]|nr:CpsD/CapB family tyrosine-protein kinase [Pseudomonadota bacterium]